MDTSSLKDRYVHAMVLSGVGDALGYYNGSWEFCHNGKLIHEEMMKLGGLENILVRLPKWMVSDDTVMHLATGEALLSQSNQPDKEKLFSALASAYKECMRDMSGRSPGNTCMSSVYYLKPGRPHGYRISFNPRGGGCGAAMRAMCIGMRYPRPEELEELITVSVESGRMTHHNPTGFLGSLASALFTAYAIQGKHINSWGRGLLDTLPKALDYIKSTGYCVEENVKAWGYFTEQWKKYLKLRNLEDGETPPTFPETYGFVERDAFVKSVSFSGWGGSSGHDAPMLAYDALLGANGRWHELCNRAMFHAGDSDSTGVIAACWFGVMNGIEGVPVLNYKYVEYKDRLVKVGKGLFDLAFPNYVENQDPIMSPEEKAEGPDEKEPVANQEPEECPFSTIETIYEHDEPSERKKEPTATQEHEDCVVSADETDAGHNKLTEKKDEKEPMANQEPEAYVVSIGETNAGYKELTENNDDKELMANQEPEECVVSTGETDDGHKELTVTEKNDESQQHM